MIATPSGAALAYIKEGVFDIRLGMFDRDRDNHRCGLRSPFRLTRANNGHRRDFGLALPYSAYASLRPHTDALAGKHTDRAARLSRFYLADSGRPEAIPRPPCCKSIDRDVCRRNVFQPAWNRPGRPLRSFYPVGWFCLGSCRDCCNCVTAEGH